MFQNKISEKELFVAISNQKNKYSSDYEGLNIFKLKKIRKYTVCYSPGSYIFSQQLFWQQRFPELLIESRNYPTV